jgi:hypothetical protein
MPNENAEFASRKWKIATAVVTGCFTVIASIGAALITANHAIDANDNGISDASQRLEILKTQINDIRKMGVPVGTIVASTLTPKQFAIAADDSPDFDPQKSKWALANGDEAKGTNYAMLTGNAKLPNLCAVFLRGKKNGRSQDPSGNSLANVEEVELGEYRPDIVGPHTHDQYLHMDKDNKTGEMGMRWDGYSNLNSPVVVRGWNPGGENIVKNVTVNYFIRINK